MKIVVVRADPNIDAKYIAGLIGICREERRTVLNHYTVEEEREYIKNLHSRDAVFVARIDGEKFAGFASIARRWPYSKRLKHCGEVGTWGHACIPQARCRNNPLENWNSALVR